MRALVRATAKHVVMGRHRTASSQIERNGDDGRQVRQGEIAEPLSALAIAQKIQQYARFAPSKSRFKRKLWNGDQLLVIWLGLICILLGEYAILSVVYTRVPAAQSWLTSEGPNAPMPGMAYTMMELQCRSWNRFRGDSYRVSFDGDNQSLGIGL